MDSNPTLIAVMGVTGAGKTTFVSKATGRDDLKIGSGLKSCTKEISAATVRVSGKEVTLIDTPGFDDTEQSDADILESISDYLLQTYHRGILLTGVVLLQPITGNRVKGSERRRLRLFEKICGEKAFSHVIIATTMWSELSSSVDGESRVSERRSDYWGDLLRHGAQVVSHDNTPKSALNIVGSLVKKGTVALRMQNELDSNNGVLMETAAGKQLHADLGDDIKSQWEIIAKLEKQLREDRAKREELVEELREQQAEYDELQRQQLLLKKKRVFLSKIVPAWLSALCMAGGGAAINLGLCNIL